VVNVTESALGKTAFKACVDPGDKKEDSTFYGDLLIGQLEEGAAAARKPVEDTYVGVVGDNVQYNQNAVKQVKAKFPKLFGPGCVAHCTDLLMEDLCDGIPEIKDLVKQSRAVAVFVKAHGRVKAAFKRIIGSKGTMLVLFPDTRFGYADKTVERVCKNQENLASLVDGAGWRTLLSNADGQQTTNFVATVNDVFFFKISKLLRKLTGPLSALVHHLERGEARASNVYPLYSALEKHAVASKSSKSRPRTSRRQASSLAATWSASSTCRSGS